jgi:transcriptional regulator with XRE-family HTH domain
MYSGYLVKILRTTKQINQKTVSEKLGFSQQAYSKLERSEFINKSTVQKVLAALNCTLEELEALRNILPSKKGVV